MIFTWKREGLGIIETEILAPGWVTQINLVCDTQTSSSNFSTYLTQPISGIINPQSVNPVFKQCIGSFLHGKPAGRNKKKPSPQHMRIPRCVGTKGSLRTFTGSKLDMGSDNQRSHRKHKRGRRRCEVRGGQKTGHRQAGKKWVIEVFASGIYLRWGGEEKERNKQKKKYRIIWCGPNPERAGNNEYLDMSPYHPSTAGKVINSLGSRRKKDNGKKKTNCLRYLGYYLTLFSIPNISRFSPGRKEGEARKKRRKKKPQSERKRLPRIRCEALHALYSTFLGQFILKYRPSTWGMMEWIRWMGSKVH